jgi:peptide-methionine (R)-S-oxide reductase
MNMTRRGWLQGLLAAGLWSAFAGRATAQQVRDMKGIEELQKNWKMLLAEGFKAPQPGEPLKLPDAEWKKRLSPMAYDVLREEGTERAGTSPLNAEKREGVFVCAGCDLPVFTSAMKYESGTGWPSGGHHGHVFEDGPLPTRQRWCNNGVALRFVPKTGKA